MRQFMCDSTRVEREEGREGQGKLNSDKERWRREGRVV